MDKSLSTLCDALKKILHHLKPQHHAISFVIMTGKAHQGISALLKQSHLTLFPVDNEHAHFYYNTQGVILELGESWLNETPLLLAHTLKQLNRCHRNVRVSGLILCVDASELLLTEPIHLGEQCRSHTQLLERFAQSLGYPVDAALFISKLDALAGFCDFFHAEHPSDLNKPLGFSVHHNKQRKKLLEHYRYQFDHMIETLGQQVITKLHPTRSSIKRTHIREFPLQLASLVIPIQSLLQRLPLNLIRLQAIYFTSAEQGGLSLDRLNKKIQHEYALTVQDTFPQSNNYRAYFIEGAIKSFQEQTKRHIPKLNPTQKWLSGAAFGCLIVSLLAITHKHLQTAQLLDEASKELLAYETLVSQSQDRTSALYHLSLAATKLEQIPSHFLTVPLIDQLKTQLKQSSQNRLRDNFIPDLLAQVESILTNPRQSLVARYEALKVYLMLAEPEHYAKPQVMQWFNQYWQENNKDGHKQSLLLEKVLKEPRQPFRINPQLVSDVRNYLNALPPTYLYYSLAKNRFLMDKQAIAIEGFDLGSAELPQYYTKAGFKKEISAIPDIAAQLQRENWVLVRQDLTNLPTLLEEAYCFEYLTWWQNFIRRTKPQRYLGFQQAKELTQTLNQQNAFTKVIELIQKHTAPELSAGFSLFNEKIAHEFTALNLISQSALQELKLNLQELSKFLTTISLVNDEGKTIFDITKNRFQNGASADPLSMLYQKSRQLPEPIATWTKQLADDSWTILINESRSYLNKQWRDTVYREYQTAIINRYPLEAAQGNEISLQDFDHFFAPHGTLNTFVHNYLKPFLDTSVPQWQSKELNGYVLPISEELINELIRANVISNMFFPEGREVSKIDFSLQKINLDPVVARLQLHIGDAKLQDDQNSESFTRFTWPQNDAKLILNSIEGHRYELAETGPWAFFKMLEKVNVLVDSHDSASLQILFEVNGNSGRYALKTQNQINPFSPGILTGFSLRKEIT